MKNIFALIGLVSCMNVYAHDMWVAAPHTMNNNQVLHADLAYGDRYPHGTTIEAKRALLFQPLEIMNEQGKRSTLKLVEDNYRYASTSKLQSGTYYILGTYRPTFWLKNADGQWFQDKNLKDVPNATHCEQTQMFAKSLLVVGKQYRAQMATQPIGQMLEIVPLKNPLTVKAGEFIPIQVLYQGKALVGATITATADTVLAKDPDSKNAHREIQGYSAKTDKDGKANFVPLIEGLWKLRVNHKADFEQSDVCQYHSLYATLMMPVGKQRSTTQHKHEHHHDH